MGLVYAEITLKNAFDVGKAYEGQIAQQEVRSTAVRALVDTGAGTLIITNAVKEKLGLRISGLRSATLGDNTKAACKVTEPVEVHWNGRATACPALVVPGDGEVLLGAIPLEDMDLIVNPAKQTLEGAHGDEVICSLRATLIKTKLNRE